MKVLVTCIPQAGHWKPLVPLVSACLAQGDDVVVASGEALRSEVTALGAVFTPAGKGLEDWFGRLAGRTRGAPGDGLPPHRIGHYFLPRLFAEIAADDMIDEVLAAARGLAPDVLVYDTYAFAGPLVAELMGAHSVHHLIGPLLDPEVLVLAADAVAPLWRCFDKDVPDLAGVYRELTVAVCPPALESRSVPSGDLAFVRPTPVPTEPAVHHSPPLVYVTFGTLWADAGLVRMVLAAIDGADVQVVVTLGGLDPHEVGPVPPNVRLESFVPQDELLPRCSAVIHHAGAGTMFGALAHGLPQLALPQAADNFINAELLAGSGAGLSLMPGAVTADAVAEALRDLLSDPGYGQAAQGVATQIAAMPTAEQLAAALRERVASPG